MIGQTNAEKRRCLAEQASEGNILGAGRRFTARMVVKQDDAGGADEKSLLENLSGLHGGAGEGSSVDLAVPEQAAGAAQEKRSENLLIAGAVAQVEVATSSGRQRGSFSGICSAASRQASSRTARNRTRRTGLKVSAAPDPAEKSRPSESAWSSSRCSALVTSTHAEKRGQKLSIAQGHRTGAEDSLLRRIPLNHPFPSKLASRSRLARYLFDVSHELSFPARPVRASSPEALQPLSLGCRGEEGFCCVSLASAPERAARRRHWVTCPATRRWLASQYPQSSQPA